MNIFITGASGYIGGSLAVVLKAKGHSIRGLVRDKSKLEQLQALGITPVLGTLEDENLIASESAAADGVINAANADHLYAVLAILRGLRGSHKPFIHTSGSSIVGDDACGSASSLTFTEDIPRPIRPEKTARCEIDKIVLSAAHQGIRTCVLCPTLIFGEGKGLNTESIQVPRMIQTALAKNGARFIGRGQNIWSTVHIDDLTMAYCLALEKAEAGSFFFLSSRQIRFVDLANTIQQQLGLPGEAKSWPVEEASKEWGLEGAHFAFGSNSQVSSAKARMVLGWLPSEIDVLTDLARVCAKFKALKTNNL